MAYMPYFSTPDPTVKRKTGFLMPAVMWDSTYGYGVEAPFYWAIAPDYDATFSPRFTTQQGVLLQAEFRQRLLEWFVSDPRLRHRPAGPRRVRRSARRPSVPRRHRNQGPVRAQRQMGLGLGRRSALRLLLFVGLHGLSQYKDPMGSFLTLPTEAISQLYLTGVGNRSYFDARAIYYLSFSGLQNQVPVVAPVIDYSNVINHSVLGGEVSYKTISPA